MTKNTPKFYLDSCVFIDALQKSEGRIDDILRIESDARAGKVQIVTSMLTIAEVAKCGNDENHEQSRNLNRYFNLRFISLYHVDRVVARAAADLVRRFPIKPPDAIHIATAIQTRCIRLYTYDKGEGTSSKPGLLGLNGVINGIEIKTPASHDYGGLGFPE